MKVYDYLVVGAGLFGATFAYEMTKRGKKCLVIDRREHIGGNIYCENLLAKNAVVRSTRIGKVNCFASEAISLLNDGIGEITYHGNPSFKNFQNKGMGEINKG